jgi:hypothetical protein
MKHLITLSAAALLCAAHLVVSAQAQQRSGPGPCRQGALALIAMLDDKDDKSAAYKHAFEAVTQTCGPVAKARDVTPPASGRAACRELALAVLDVLENGKMTTPAFVRARDVFAQTCAPG